MEKKSGRKPPKKFIYKMSNHDVVEKLNHERPISLYNFQEIIDGIHQKYPMYSKNKIKMVVEAAIESMRELLIQGNILSIYEIFHEMKLSYHKVKKTKQSKPIIKIYATPNKKMRKFNTDDKI